MNVTAEGSPSADSDVEIPRAGVAAAVARFRPCIARRSRRYLTVARAAIRRMSSILLRMTLLFLDKSFNLNYNSWR